MRTVALGIAALALLGSSCDSKKEQKERVHDLPDPELTVPSTPSTTPTTPRPGRKVVKTAGAVPTSEEAALALSIGKSLFLEGEFEDAETNLKIAAAGGKPEAESLLLRMSAERQAKVHFAAARKKLEDKDWTGAEAELAAVPSESVLRKAADKLADQVGKAKDEAQAAESKRLEQALLKDDKGTPLPKDDDEEEPKPEPDESH